MASGHLYHLVPKASWEACKASKTAYFPPTYDQDGFIHLTADPALLLTVANHFYKAAQGEWIVLKLAAGKLTSEVKYEPAAPVGNTPSAGLTGQDKKEEPLFPHLYGTIDYEAVAQELPVHRGGDGTYLSIAGL